MSTKACKECGTEKQLIEFSQNRAVCKSCRNRKQVTKYKAVTQHQSIDEQEIDFLAPLKVQIAQLSLVFALDANLNEKMSMLINDLQNALLTAKNIKNGVRTLAIKIQMSPELRIYLSQVFEDGGTFLNAKGYLAAQDIDGFKKYFKLLPSQISKQEIDDLDKVTSFVKVVYQLLLEDWVDCNSKYSLRVAKVETPLVELDSDKSQLIIANNPLELDFTQFMVALAELDKSNSITFKMYKDLGIYKKFMDLTS